MIESIKGSIGNIIFRNEENGYTVFTLLREDAGEDEEETTCTGSFPSVRSGETVELYGTFVEHVSYGRQFRVQRYELRLPESAAAIERYLASGAVKGIGKALAARIVKEFGADTLRILYEEPECLAQIKGISERKAREIGGLVAAQEDQREAMLFLAEYDIPLPLGMKIYRAYGREMYRILKENPYRLAEDIEGIGFVRADAIARKTGIRADDGFRVRAAAVYVLETALAEGNVYLPEEEAVQRTAGLTGAAEDLIRETLTDLAIDRKTVLKKGNVYLSKAYYTELSVARKLLDLAVICDDAERERRTRIDSLLSTSALDLAPEQEECIDAAAKYGLTVITGGPGTGKTTVIEELLRYFGLLRYEVVLAAPTGRAAKRIQETTGHEAATIHRLLEIAPVTEGGREVYRFGRNEECPLEADVVIIDEMSMVDIFLMDALLSAISAGTRLILVGDADQLPSVGPGSVLRDMIAAERFPTIRLTQIFRQAGTSDIVLNAHAVNRGEKIDTTNRSRDFFFLERDDPGRIISNMLLLIREKLPPYLDTEPSGIQVLTPMRKGPLGTERLNRILQQHLNPPDPGKEETLSGENVFRTGDKVMQTKNDYQLAWEVRGRYGIPVDQGEGVFNGDIGTVAEIDPRNGEVTVVFEEARCVTYLPEQLPELSLAYAVTVHKAQGSEYPAVLLPLLGGPSMLFTRNLLYTAITRARKCVVILGKESTVQAMTDNIYGEVRYTSLAERIQEIAALTGRGL